MKLPSFHIEVAGAQLDDSETATPVVFDVGNRPRQIEFTVRNPISLTGVVHPEAGLPVSGIRVLAEAVDKSWGCVPCGFADSDGHFTLQVPALPAVVTPIDLSGTIVITPASVEVRSADVELEFRAEPPKGLLVGRVVNYDEEPVVGVRVFVGSGEAGSFVRTSEDGFFRAPCTSGEAIEIGVEASQGYLMAKWSSSTGDCEQQVVIRLVQGGAIEGTVIDSGGMALDGFPLRVIDQHGNPKATRSTQGSYVFEGLPRGRYSIVAGDGRSQFSVRSRSSGVRDAIPSVEVVVRERVREDLEVVSGGTLCIEVTDVDGGGLRPERLDLFLAKKEDPVLRVTQRMGDEELCTPPIPPGAYLVRFGERGAQVPRLWWPGETSRKDASAVRIRAGRSRTLGPLELPPEGTIALQMSDGETLARYTRVELAEVLEEPSDRESLAWYDVDPARVEEVDGRSGPELHIHGVPEGSWVVRLCRTDSCDDGQRRETGAIAVERHAYVRTRLPRTEGDALRRQAAELTQGMSQ